MGYAALSIKRIGEIMSWIAVNLVLGLLAIVGAVYAVWDGNSAGHGEGAGSILLFFVCAALLICAAASELARWVGIWTGWY